MIDFRNADKFIDDVIEALNRGFWQCNETVLRLDGGYVVMMEEDYQKLINDHQKLQKEHQKLKEDYQQLQEAKEQAERHAGYEQYRASSSYSDYINYLYHPCESCDLRDNINCRNECPYSTD